MLVAIQLRPTLDEVTVTSKFVGSTSLSPPCLQTLRSG